MWDKRPMWPQPASPPPPAVCRSCREPRQFGSCSKLRLQSVSPALSLSGGLLSRALIPGGGVMGAAGRNAAHVVFKDLKNM